MSAATSLGALPVGTINFFDTHIGAWEEPSCPVQGIVIPDLYERFRSLLARLRDHRGFRVHQDTSVPPRIRRLYYVGRKGDLEFHAEAHGRMFEIGFFQNINVENPNGGRHDFGRFARMPRTMQLACAVEMSHVLRKLFELGYVLDGTRRGITSAELLPVLRHAQGRTDEGDPLAKFNRSWGGDRFERDASGWPTVDSVTHGGRTNRDRDGLPIVSGEMMYYRQHGRLFRGIARPGPNAGWYLISHDSYTHVWSWELFRCEDPSAEPRRFIPGQQKRVRSELEKALKANAYQRVETLAHVVRRLDAAHLAGNEGSRT